MLNLSKNTEVQLKIKLSEIIDGTLRIIEKQNNKYFPHYSGYKFERDLFNNDKIFITFEDNYSERNIKIYYYFNNLKKNVSCTFSVGTLKSDKYGLYFKSTSKKNITNLLNNWFIKINEYGNKINEEIYIEK